MKITHMLKTYGRTGRELSNVRSNKLAEEVAKPISSNNDLSQRTERKSEAR
ncbi:hypothetical protein Leryth_025388, partial [Lithospermum erythrorhizon]